MIRIVVLAALPQEYRPLLELLGSPRRLVGAPFPAWLQRSSYVELILVETGMGREGAVRAARHLLSGSRIDLLMSVGFAGSLWPAFRLGQVVWARELVEHDGRGEHPSLKGFRASPGAETAAFCRSHMIEPARFLTVDRVLPKAGMAARFAQDPTVLEMESTPVAEAAWGHGVPFLGLRAVSDEVTRDIGWQVDAISDRAGRVSAPKVVWAVLRRPALLRSLLELRTDSRIAGRRLAATTMALLSLPEADLLALTRQTQLRQLPRGARGHSDG
jgi:nucleoside phosphorylase